MTCERCGHPLEIGEWPFCPHGRAGSGVIGDEIDVVIENNGTNQPIRFRSREAMRKHFDAHNLTPMVRHTPLPGSDKSPHTTDWSQGIDAQTLENARILLARPTSRMAEDEPPPLPIEVTVRTLDTGFVVKMERD
jgi:hypothetical protein